VQTQRKKYRAYHEEGGDFPSPEQDSDEEKKENGTGNEEDLKEQTSRQEKSIAKLTANRISVLNAIGFPWNVRGDSYWQKYYDALVQYKAQNGDVKVPRLYAENPRLGEWVTDQRKQYKLKCEGSHSCLTDERKKKLDQLGFVWKVRDRADWNDRYEQLLEFKKVTGHCKVPQHYSQNRALGKWVAKQREQYRFYREGRHSFLTDERIDLLKSIGFIWKVKGRGYNKAVADGEDALDDDDDDDRVYGDIDGEDGEGTSDNKAPDINSLENNPTVSPLLGQDRRTIDDERKEVRKPLAFEKVSMTTLPDNNALGRDSSDSENVEILNEYMTAILASNRRAILALERRLSDNPHWQFPEQKFDRRKPSSKYDGTAMERISGSAIDVTENYCVPVGPVHMTGTASGRSVAAMHQKPLFSESELRHLHGYFGMSSHIHDHFQQPRTSVFASSAMNHLSVAAAKETDSFGAGKLAGHFPGTAANPQTMTSIPAALPRFDDPYSAMGVPVGGFNGLSAASSTDDYGSMARGVSDVADRFGGAGGSRVRALNKVDEKRYSSSLL